MIAIIGMIVAASAAMLAEWHDDNFNCILFVCAFLMFGTTLI